MLPIIIKTYQLTGYYSTLDHLETNSIYLTIGITFMTYMILYINRNKSSIIWFSFFFSYLIERNKEEQKSLKKKVKDTQLYDITKEKEREKEKRRYRWNKLRDVEYHHPQ